MNKGSFTKILLLVILLSIIPQASASASIFINQTAFSNVYGDLTGQWAEQTFTTPNYANATTYNLDYIQLRAASVNANPETITINITSGTTVLYTTSIIATNDGSVGNFQWLQFNFTYPAVLNKNTVYAFNITASGAAGGADLDCQLGTNPYTGGRAFSSDGAFNANDDLTFIIGLEPHDNVASWTMNQGSGNFANDSSGFNNNASLVNTTWATNLNNGSVNSTALEFTGNGNFTAVSNDSLNITQAITISTWFKPNTTYQTGSPNQELLAKALNGGGATLSYLLGLNGNGKLRFIIGSGTATTTVSTIQSTWSPQWYHVVTEWDGTTNANGIKIYVNGILDNEATSTISSMVACACPLTVGYLHPLFDGFNGTIDEVKIYNYALNSTEITALNQQFQPVPAYPVANTIIPAAYPPLQTTVNFVWYDTVYPADEIQIAQDSSFNVMVSDQFFSTDSASIGLNAGTTYFWRIKQYNPTTGLFGNTSLTQTFSISSAPSIPAAGSSIQGITYEILNGVQTPVSGAIVYLSNSTSSATFTTSTNGYFLFQNLASNSTYTIYATNAPIYNPSSPVFITTPTTATTATSNILLTRFFSPFVPNYVYEKFIVRDLFENKYSGVTVNIFEDGNVVATATANTDSMGQAVFQLIKNTYYRAEFSGGGLSSTITQYFYAKEEEYEVIVLTGTPSRNVTTQSVNVTLDHSAFNATYENLTLYYNDASLSTTQVNFLAYNTTTGTFVLVCSQHIVSTNVVQVGCQVPKTGNSYSWGYNATNMFGYSTGYDTLSTPVTINTTLSATVLNWISIILLVVLVSMFSKRNIKQGAIVLPLMAFILSLPPLGWLSVNPLYPGICLVLGVLVYMRRKEVENQL